MSLPWLSSAVSFLFRVRATEPKPPCLHLLKWRGKLLCTIGSSTKEHGIISLARSRFAILAQGNEYSSYAKTNHKTKIQYAVLQGNNDFRRRYRSKYDIYSFPWSCLPFCYCCCCVLLRMFVCEGRKNRNDRSCNAKAR